VSIFLRARVKKTKFINMLSSIVGSNDTQHDNTQHNYIHQSACTLMPIVILLSVVVRNVVMLCDIQRRYAECRDAVSTIKIFR
jgi:hypothetical protein